MRRRTHLSGWIAAGVLGLAAAALAPGALSPPSPPGTVVTAAPPRATPATAAPARTGLPLGTYDGAAFVLDAPPRHLTRARSQRHLRLLADDTAVALRRVVPGLRLRPVPGAPATDDATCGADDMASLRTVAGTAAGARTDTVVWALWDYWRAIPGAFPEVRGGRRVGVVLASRGAAHPGGPGAYHITVVPRGTAITVTVAGPCL